MATSGESLESQLYHYNLPVTLRHQHHAGWMTRTWQALWHTVGKTCIFGLIKAVEFLIAVIAGLVVFAALVALRIFCFVLMTVFGLYLILLAIAHL
jgi:beta-glucosidase/6-phospho-beta-glucosidase/beta-galactosidase